MKQEDKRFRQALDQDVPQWDDAPIWDEIEKTLPPKEDKRRFIWFFLGLGLLALVASTFFLLPETNKIDAKVTLESESNYVNQKTTIKNNTNNKTLELESKGLEVKELKTKTVPISNPPKHFATRDQKSNSINKSIEYDPANSITTRTEQPIQNVTKHANQLITRTTTTAKLQAYPKLPFLQYLNALAVNQNTFNIGEREFDALSQGIAKKIIPLKSKSNSNHFEIFGGIYYTVRKINSSQIEADAFLDKTKPVETYDLGLKYSLDINSNWALSTGLIRRQTTEIFSSQDTLITMDQVLSDTATIVGVVPLPGLLNRTTFTPRRISNPNRLRQLLIPIQVSYRLPLAKMDLLMNIGTDFRLTSSYSGYAIDRNGKATTDNQTIGNLHNSSFTLNSLNFSASSEFYLTNSLGLNVGVFMSYGLTDHYSDDNIEMTYNHYGARIGLVKKLK